MNISKFNLKFNKLEGNIYTVEEEITLTNNLYDGPLAHDNINKKTLNIYTGSMLTGDKITNYFLSTPSETAWKYTIKVMANVDKAYITYETTGDQVEAEDINNLQNEIVRTQQEINSYEQSNDEKINNIDVRVTNVEENKADKDKVFTKEEVMQKISDLINGSPQTLDTLNEIANALGNDPNFSTTIINLLGNKVEKVDGKQLSTEDYSPQEKSKLASVQDNANYYELPETLPVSMITEDENHMFVTSEEKAAINTSGNDSVFQTAGGTGNAITLTLPSLVNGYAKTFIAGINNNGAATTINGKQLYKPGATTAPTLIAGKAYTVWYNLAGDCFFIKASAEGNTIASHVLAGDTFSNNVDTGLVGTMPSKASATITPSTSAQTIAAGQYLSGAQTINPVTGTANTGHVLSGYTFASANGIGLTGTIVSKTAQTYTPSTTNQTISAGQYLGDIQTILGDSDLIASNIIDTANIFNIQGTANIQSLGGIRGARSTVSVVPFTVSGLNFTPNVVIISHLNSSGAVVTLIYVGGSGYLVNSTTWFQMVNASTTNGTGVPSGVTIRSDGFTYSKNALISGGTVYWLAFSI